MAFRSRRLALLATALLAAAGGGCAEGSATGPRAARPLDLVYLDNVYRLMVMRVGEAPTRTSIYGAVPLAAAGGAMLYVDSAGRLMRFDLARGAADPVPQSRPRTNAAALSADGHVLAWLAQATAGIFVYFADVHAGTRDSIDLLPTTEPATLLRMLGATPALSEDGGRVGFLYPTPFGMQFVVVTRADRRVEVREIDDAVAGVAQLIEGWPRWMPDDAVRFGVRLHDESGEPGDTIGVVEVRPLEPNAPARLLYAAPTPDSLPMEDAREYSLSDDGEALALTVATGGREGVFLLRRTDSRLQPLVFGAGVSPHYPILVPAAPAARR